MKFRLFVHGTALLLISSFLLLPSQAAPVTDTQEQSRNVEETAAEKPLPTNKIHIKEIPANLEEKLTRAKQNNAEKTQPSSWQKFDENFLTMEDHLADLTEDELKEINKKDAIPLHFLKGLSAGLRQNEPLKIPGTLGPNQIPIIITIPIVINAAPGNFPQSLSIGNQEIPLNFTIEQKDTIAATKAEEKESSIPTAQYNKLLDYKTSSTTEEPQVAGPPTTIIPGRQTNRHRSNKIHSQNEVADDYDY